MIDSDNLLTLITARSGSKRLPQKNILDFHGSPLITWTIKAALETNFIKEVIVSTDSNKISEICIKQGASVPFLRPAGLSEDDTSSIDVLRHALKNLNIKKYKYILLLQPTSPLRNSDHINDSIMFFNNNKAKALISISKVVHESQKKNFLTINKNDPSYINFINIDEKVMKKYENYRINGAIYLTSIDNIMQYNSLISKIATYAYEMSPLSSIDIDTKEDFEIAMKLLEKSEKSDL